MLPVRMHIPLPLLFASRHEFQQCTGAVSREAHAFASVVEASVPLASFDAESVGTPAGPIFVLLKKQNTLARLRKNVAA